MERRLAAIPESVKSFRQVVALQGVFALYKKEASSAHSPNPADILGLLPASDLPDGRTI